MHQYVAQFLADFAVGPAGEGVAEFVNLFNRVAAKAFVGLFVVPGTLFSQLVDDVEQATEGLQFLFFGMHCHNGCCGC